MASNYSPQAVLLIAFRGKIWYHDEIKAYCLPFLGSDKSVVGRSQYINYQLYKDYPVSLSSILETCFMESSGRVLCLLNVLDVLCICFRKYLRRGITLVSVFQCIG